MTHLYGKIHILKDSNENTLHYPIGKEIRNQNAQESNSGHQTDSRSANPFGHRYPNQKFKQKP